MKKKSILGLFVKVPILGSVKTRLQPELQPEEALFFYKAMAEDIIRRFKHTEDYDMVLFYWPENGESTMRDWLGNEYTFLAQTGSDLGERMYNAFVWAMCRGYEKAVIIGSDTPTVDASTVEEAFTTLEDSDVVIGPAYDGGYYLIGLKKPRALLFLEMAWGKDTVMKETRERIKKAGLRFKELPRKRDIDIFPDVVYLWNRMNNQNKKENFSGLVHTRKALQKILKNKTWEDRNDRGAKV